MRDRYDNADLVLDELADTTQKQTVAEPEEQIDEAYVKEEKVLFLILERLPESAHDPIDKFFKEVVASDEGLGEVDYVKKSMQEWPSTPLSNSVFEYLQLRHFFHKVVSNTNYDCMLNMKDFFECMTPMGIEFDQKQRLAILRKNQVGKFMAVKNEQDYDKLRFDHELWLKIVNQRLTLERKKEEFKEQKQQRMLDTMYIREDFGNDSLQRLHMGISSVANKHEECCVDDYMTASKRATEGLDQQRESHPKMLISFKDMDLKRLSRSTTSHYLKTQEFESAFVRELINESPNIFGVIAQQAVTNSFSGRSRSTMVRGDPFGRRIINRVDRHLSSRDASEEDLAKAKSMRQKLIEKRQVYTKSRTHNQTGQATPGIILESAESTVNQP